MSVEKQCDTIANAHATSPPEPEPEAVSNFVAEQQDRLPSDLALLHVGGTAPSARALAWVRLFHSDLMVENFKDDELEAVDEWEERLQSDTEERKGVGCLDECEVAAGFDQSVPYEIEFHLFMLAHGTSPETADADGLPDPDVAGATVVAGACCEVYMNSSVGLLTYLVTHTSQRGKGLARRLCNEVRQTVRARSPRGSDSLLVLECHRAGVTDETMHCLARLATYEKLGWLGLNECPFVVPAVREGLDDPEPGNMCLLVHGSCVRSLQDDRAIEGTDSDGGGVDAEILRAWFMEYWAACYSEDLTPLRRMIEYLEPLSLVPIVPPTHCALRE